MHRGTILLRDVLLTLWHSLEASVTEDVDLIKADPFLPEDLEVLGFVYDTISGETTEVV